MARRRSSGAARRPDRRWWWIGTAVLAVIAVTVGVLVVVGHRASDDTVATVDGRAVTGDELGFHVQRVLATRQSGTTTTEQLRQAALQDIAHDDALLGWARQYGLAPFADFAEFRRLVQRTNDERAAALAQGEVVYGLTRYTDAQYYDKSLSDVRSQLIQKLSSGTDPAIAVTDAEVATYYRAHRSDWRAGVADYRATRLLLPRSAVGDQTPASFARAVADAGSLAAAARRLPGATVSSVSLSAAAANGQDPSISPQTFQQLQTLAVGQTTDPQTSDGGLVIFRLDRIAVDDQEALQQYGTRIRAVLVEQEFDAVLAGRIAAQTIDIRHPAWDAVSLEDRQS